MVTKSEYEKMSDEQKYYHQAVYQSYKTEKYRSYDECECCGTRRYLGWAERRIPQGEIIGYEELEFSTMVPYIYAKEIQSHAAYALKNTLHEYLKED